MSKTLNRLYFALAAMDLTKSQLSHLHAEIVSTPPFSFSEGVLRISDRMQFEPETDDFAVHHRSAARFTTGSIGERVEQLLKVEAGLGSADAVRLLAESLVEAQVIDLEEVPPVSRKSFRDWVERLAMVVPDKELLRHATLLRNLFAHRPISDWTLSRPKK